MTVSSRIIRGRNHLQEGWHRWTDKDKWRSCPKWRPLSLWFKEASWFGCLLWPSYSSPCL